jgi:hypothetical protein
VLDLETLGSCAELTSAHAKLAASSPAAMRLLLERVAAIAKPGEGCPKVLTAVAHLMGQEWVDGRLYVELAGDDEATTLTVMADYGVGIRERILPATRFLVPFDEFARALELSPALVLPLRITDHGTKLVLTPLLTPEEQGEQAPPTFEVDDRSLGEDLRKTAPPPAEAVSLRESFHEVPEAPTRPNQTILTDPDE